MSVEKHQDELENFGIDFTNRLGGETISSIDVLEIHDLDGRNVTTQFGALGEQVSGAQVNLTLNPASSALDQVAGLYRIYCEITTSGGRKLVETPSLTITDRSS